MAIIYSVFCPMCGVVHSNRVIRDPARKNQIVSRVKFWEGRSGGDAEHKYGVIQESQGRGTLRVIREFSPNEDPSGSFFFVKDRMLAAVKEWVEKGWIDKGEVEGMLGDSRQGPPLPPFMAARVAESAPPPKVKPVPFPAAKKVERPKKEKPAPKATPKVKPRPAKAAAKKPKKKHKK